MNDLRNTFTAIHQEGMRVFIQRMHQDMKSFQWDKIKYGDRIIHQTGLKNVILHNVNNNQTVKISKEVYEVISQICSEELSIVKVLENCESQEDQDFLLENMEYLAENQIIREINDDSEYMDMPIKIDLDITNRCNLRCKHCCVSADITKQDLSKEEMFELVDKVVSVNPIAITISGGEPLIRNDFKEIILRIREKYNGRIDLMTNAVLIDDDKAKFIADTIDAVSVSLDGVDEETCCAIRGKGVFDKTIQGIKRLQNAGMTKISASMVVTKVTYKHKKQFFELCEGLDIKPFLRGLSLVGRATEEMKDMIPDEDDETEYIRSNETPAPVTATKGKVPTFSCGAAYKQFQVDFRGDIYPCQSLMENELLLGNVLNVNDFNEFIRKRLFVTTAGYKELEKYFPYNFSECKGCNKQIFCWNCIEPIYHERTKRDDCVAANCVLDRYWE